MKVKDNKWILVPMVIAIFLASFAFAPQAQAAGPACWGQASAVFAQMGEMGEHSSEQPTPRDGLRNLARYLFNEGIILDDSMAALGAFVADALGLSIDACM